MKNLITDIPIFWLIPMVLLSLGLSIFLYYKDKRIAHLKNWLKIVLIGMRFLSLMLICVLLFGLLFEKEETQFQKPLLVFQVDDSQSMVNYDDSTVVKSLKSKIDKLKNELGDDYDYLLFPNEFDGGFTQDATNLSKDLATLSEQYAGRNIGAIVQITDGNFNQGLSPEIASENLKFVPFYTVGVGDTVKKKDQLISDYQSNKIGFLGNEIPVSVELNQFGMDGQDYTFQLYANDKLIKEEKGIYEKNVLPKFEFLIPANRVGLMHLKGILVANDNEFTLENNSFDVYVNILDSKSKILFLTEVVTSDAMAFKQVFRSDKNTQVVVKKVDKLAPNEIEDYDLLVVNGVGNTAKGKLLLDKISKSNKSLIILAGINAPNNLLSTLKTGISFRGSNRQDKVNGKLNPDFSDFKVEPNFAQLMTNAPPLSVKSGTYQLSGNGSVLAFQSLGSLQKKSPLFVVSKSMENKVFTILGEGLWRWRIYDYQTNQSFEKFDGFIKKIVQYLKVNSKKSRLQIDNLERIKEGDNLKFNAEFYDDAFERTVTPEIEMVLKSSDSLEQKFTFLKSSDFYELRIDGLNSGLYNWKATTNFNGKKYSKSGVVVIEKVSLEKLATNSNFRLLKSIAEKSGGEFVGLENFESLASLIKNDKNVTRTSYVENSYEDLLDYKWILFLIALLLCAEWFIRKYSGTY